MGHKVDPDFLPKLQPYGAFDISACFNCGNCTAICPLSSETVSFPRGVIRNGHLGLKDRLLGRVDVWQCFYCGECSETCPREADPAEYVMAARRYAIAHYDVTGLSRLMYTKPLFNWVFSAFLFVMGLFVLRNNFDQAANVTGYYLPTEVADFVHYASYAGMAFLALVGGLNALNAYRFIASQYPPLRKEGEGLFTFFKRWIGTLVVTIKDEAILHKDFSDCDDVDVPWFRKRWLVHGMMVWGFIGLMVATLLAWAFPTHGQEVALWTPSRAVGIIFGIIFLFGVSMVLLNRIQKKYYSNRHSGTSDWLFLLMLFVVALTGFLTTISIYTQLPTAVEEWVLLSHIIISMELLILAPFSKFAHAAYRIFALWIDRAHRDE